MNLAIRQTSRKISKQHHYNHHQHEIESKSLSSMNRMMEKFGLDPTTFDDEAEAIWTMLNNLHETDPISYQHYIQQQMEEMKKFEAGGKNTVKTFTPKKGFVVKAFVSINGVGGKEIEKSKKQGPVTKLFVNFCHHDVVNVPIRESGAKVTDNDIAKSITDAQIPMLISTLRDDFKDATNRDACTIDVVLNPWCLRKCQDDTIFKAQMITLSLNSIMEEKNVIIQPKTWKVIKSTYKGGVAVGSGETFAVQVHPFPVDSKMIQPKNDIGGNAIHMSNEESEYSSREEERTSIMKDPQSLLQSLRSDNPSNNKEEESFISLNSITKGEKQSSSKRPLIQEIEEPKADAKLIEEVHTVSSNYDDDSSQAKISCNRKNSSQSKSKGVPLATTMKGFLNKIKKEQYKAIYETPSSGDGMEGSGGSYAKLMSKCQVVDTSELTNKQQSLHDSEIDGKEKAFDKGIKKGFLQSGERLFSEDDSLGRGNFDVEFDAIMKRADPNFAQTFKDTSETEIPMEDIDNAIKALGDGISPMHQQQSRKTGGMQLLQPIQPDLPQKRHEQIEIEKGMKNKIQMTVQNESSTSVCFQFNLKDSKVANISHINVQILDHEVTIKTACGSKIKHYHTLINDNVGAKFKKKTKMLTLTFSIAD